jgi:hypothetical protein
MKKNNFDVIEKFSINNANYKVVQIKQSQSLLNIKRNELNRDIPLIASNLMESHVYLRKDNLKTTSGKLKEITLQFKKVDPQLYLAQLRLVGIGYRVFQFNVEQKDYLIFDLGSSKLTIVYIPSAIKVRAEKSSILVYGDSLNRVRSFWSRIAHLKKPDAYKGKGIQKIGVVYKLKEGKKK